MKKQFFVIAISLLIVAKGISQIAFYDATDITNKCVSKTGDTTFIFKTDSYSRKLLCTYLRNYLPNGNVNDTAVLEKQIFVAFKNNPFFGHQISLLLTGSATSPPAGFASSLLSTVGGLDVTNIANGMALFMIERAKEELTITFFNRFQKFVKKNPEVQALFPKTCENLNKLLNYKYTEMLSVLRTGFYDDLRNLTYNLDNVLELPRYQSLLKDFPEIRITIRSIRLIQELATGKMHPSEIMDKFAEFKEWNEKNASDELNNLGSSVRLASIFSQSLRIKYNNDKVWISFSDFESLINDEIAFRIYLGLIYQKTKTDNICFFFPGCPKGGKKFSQIMEEQKDNLFLFQNELTKFISLSEKVQLSFEDIKSKQANHTKLTNDDYYNYINTSIDLIEYAFEIAGIFDKNLEMTEYIYLARKSNDLFKYCYKEEYSQAMMTSIDIFVKVNELVKSRNTEIIKNGIEALKNYQPSARNSKEFINNVKALTETKDNFKKISNKQLDTIEKELTYGNVSNIDLLKIKLMLGTARSEKLNEILAEISKYGLFMANMVAAKSQEEVKSVIENSVLPVGSSSIKKKSIWNFSVQSYLGCYYNLYNGNQLNTSWNDKVGLHGPIGLALSWGMQKGGSLSLFASIFDIGAIIDYKLTQDSVPSTGTNNKIPVTKKDYQIKLGQIVSPGVFVVYGFPWYIPIALGCGYQYGPGLGKIVDDANTLVINPQWRFDFFLSVDIPLFTFYNKQRYKIKYK